MKFALFQCCVGAMGPGQYTASTQAVFNELGIEFLSLKEFNCCGYPLRNFHFRAYLLASVRNLAIAEKKALSLLTMCNCCFGSFKLAEHFMKEDDALRNEINATLAKEGLHYEGGLEPKHVLQVLHDDIGVEQLRANLRHTFRGLKIAVHHGGHILRPSEIMQFDHPFTPTKFDQLVGITGADSVSWSARLDCCGSPLMGINDDLSMDLTEKKLKNAREAGADYLCVSCPYCFTQFGKVQNMILSQRGSNVSLPPILYTQLLGLCLGLKPQDLRLEMNTLPVTDIYRFLSEN
jgi:heterodisulfide reductase subunit B